MGIDDFATGETEDKPDNSDPDSGVSEGKHELLRAVDYHIINNSEHLDLESNTIPSDPTLHVRGDVVIADRTRLASVIAVAVSQFTRDDLKDFEDFNMAEIQQMKSE